MCFPSFSIVFFLVKAFRLAAAASFIAAAAPVRVLRSDIRIVIVVILNLCIPKCAGACLNAAGIIASNDSKDENPQDNHPQQYDDLLHQISFTNSVICVLASVPNVVASDLKELVFPKITEFTMKIPNTIIPNNTITCFI